MSARCDLRRAQDGFTLIEVLAASVVLVAGLLGVIALIDVANSSTRGNLARERGTTLARELLERAREVPFSDHGTAAFTPAVRAALPDAPAAGDFEVSRGGTRFRIEVSSCLHDDPQDGVGAHDAAYCDFDDAPVGQAPADAPTGSAVQLKLLGIPISVPVGGALIDSTVCGLLGANPIGSVPALDALLGRGGAVNGLLGLLDSGAEVALCPDGSTGEQVALDREPADFSRIGVRVRWTERGRQPSVSQSTMLPNPEGA